MTEFHTSQPRRRWPVGLALALALVSAGGCRRAPVQTVPIMPELNVPPPPPRVIESVDAVAPDPVPLVDAPVRTVERPRVAPVAPPKDAKPEPKPEPPIEPRPTEEPKPVTTLKTTPTDQDAELERRIRGVIQAASADLNRVDYRRLGSDVQLQYDMAKGFVRQSEEALKSKNFVFAQTMAEKAATLASQLAGQ